MLVARGSWLVARGSWLVARASWLVPRSSGSFAARLSASPEPRAGPATAASAFRKRRSLSSIPAVRRSTARRGRGRTRMRPCRAARWRRRRAARALPTMAPESETPSTSRPTDHRRLRSRACRHVAARKRNLAPALKQNFDPQQPARGVGGEREIARGPNSAHSSGAISSSGTPTVTCRIRRTTARSCATRVASLSVILKIQFARSSIGSAIAVRAASPAANMSSHGAPITAITTSKRAAPSRRSQSITCGSTRRFNASAAPHALMPRRTP